MYGSVLCSQLVSLSWIVSRNVINFPFAVLSVSGTSTVKELDYVPLQHIIIQCHDHSSVTAFPFHFPPAAPALSLGQVFMW